MLVLSYLKFTLQVAVKKQFLIKKNIIKKAISHVFKTFVLILTSKMLNVKKSNLAIYKLRNEKRGRGLGNLAHWYVRRFVSSGPRFDYRRPLIFELHVQSVQWMLQHLNVICINISNKLSCHNVMQHCSCLPNKYLTDKFHTPRLMVRV